MSQSAEMETPAAVQATGNDHRSHVVIVTPDLDARLITFSSNRMMYYIGGIPMSDTEVVRRLSRMRDISAVVDRESNTYNIMFRAEKDSIPESLDRLHTLVTRAAAKHEVPRQELVEVVYDINEDTITSEPQNIHRPEGVIDILMENGTAARYWAEGYFSSSSSSLVKYIDLERKVLAGLDEEEVFKEGLETRARMELSSESAHFIYRGNAFFKMGEDESNPEAKLIYFMKAFQDYERAKIVTLFVTQRMYVDMPDYKDLISFLNDLSKEVIGQARCMYAALEVNSLFDGFEPYGNLVVMEMKRIQERVQDILDYRSSLNCSDCDENEGWVTTYEEGKPVITQNNPINDFVEVVESIQVDSRRLKRRVTHNPPNEMTGARLRIDYLEGKIEEYVGEELYERAAEARDEIKGLNAKIKKLASQEVDTPRPHMMSIREFIACAKADGREEDATKGLGLLNKIEIADPLFLEHPEEIPYSSFFCYLG